MRIENGEKKKKIKFKENCIFSLHESDFNYCKDYFSNDKNSKAYKIFDFLSNFLNQLSNRFNKNYLLKLELHVEDKKNDLIFSYKFFSPLGGESKHFKDFNTLSKGFEFLINEINAEKYKKIEKKLKKKK